MSCRVGCGACCIAISISSPIPGMPNGKSSGERCLQLSVDNKCILFGQPERPLICSQFQFDDELCGSNAEEAARNIYLLEIKTR